MAGAVAEGRSSGGSVLIRKAALMSGMPEPLTPSEGAMTYAIFIWHNVFLAITMSMIDVNLVFPSLITALGGSKITFTLVAGAIVPIHAPSPCGGGSGWG